MIPEADRTEPQEPVAREAEAPATTSAAPAATPPSPATVKAAKPRAGVPVWRTGKPDAFLAAAVDTARSAIEGITAASDIGAHLAAKSEGDRLVTHLFESRLPGYGGWQWFAVLTRNSRSKVVTVNELGLLPSEDSILAPEWVPWAERVRPEDEQEPEPGQDPEPEPGQDQEPEPGQEQEPAGTGPVSVESDAAEEADAEAAGAGEAVAAPAAREDQEQDQEPS